MRKRCKKFLLCIAFTALLVPVLAVPAMATGDVAGAIQSTWTAAQTQIRTVVDNVVFPVIDMILAVLFFVKVGGAYFDYRKHGQLELLFYPEKSTQDSEVDALIRKLATCDERAIKVARATIQSLIDTAPKQDP